MNTDLVDVLGVGLPAIVLALVILSVMVHRELGPFAGLGPGGRWLLTGAFGLGVFAFALKMAVAVTVHAAPQRVLGVLTADTTPAPRHGAPTEEEAAHEVPAALLAPARYIWEALPAQAPAPPGNPATPDKIALGERLFNETRLSADGTLSCASCHDLYGKGGADGLSAAVGLGGQRGPRNTPTVWNAAFQTVLFWDGRAASLEEQAGGPILNPIEMGLPSSTEAERRLASDPSYRADFARAFGDETVSFARIRMALAAYERTLITPDSPYDRFVRGDSGALSQAQLRGMGLFESVGCVRCHSGANFSAAGFPGTQGALRAFPANPTGYDTKYALLNADGSRGPWRVASLRNVALTGPWLHNGSVDELAEVVRIMASAQLARSAERLGWVDAGKSLARVDRSPLDEREVDDLVAFLHALTSDALAARAAARDGAALDEAPKPPCHVRRPCG